MPLLQLSWIAQTACIKMLFLCNNLVEACREGLSDGGNGGAGVKCGFSTYLAAFALTRCAPIQTVYKIVLVIWGSQLLVDGGSSCGLIRRFPRFALS